MKCSAILINTGRGDLVNEPDLVEALKNGVIRAAAIDVLTPEPPPAHHPFLAAGLDNLFITPHTAWSSLEARQRLIDGIVENIEDFRKLHPAFANLDPKEMATAGLSAPLHAGAMKYYKEAGLID